jgi:hypothetical protein
LNKSEEKRRKEEMKEKLKKEQLGKDHFSLLLYVESRCVDYNGKLDFDRLRINPETHPQFCGNPYMKRSWKENYGTLLSSGERLPNHDDIDCLEDIDRLGFIEIYSFSNLFVIMTKLGNNAVSKLREFKTEGIRLGSLKLSECDVLKFETVT